MANVGKDEDKLDCSLNVNKLIVIWMYGVPPGCYVGFELMSCVLVFIFIKWTLRSFVNNYCAMMMWILEKSKMTQASIKTVGS